MDDFVLPDFEGDTDFAALGVHPLLGTPMKEVKPGDPEWEEAEQAAKAKPELEDDSFPQEITQDLNGLMFLGSLQRSFSLLGHDFVMRTLKAGEELACGVVVKEYEQTLGQAKAFATAFVGAAIVSVDNVPMITPLGPDQTLSVIQQRFNYVTEHWYWPVIEALYDEFSSLVVRQAEVFQAMAGKLTAGRGTS